MTTSAPVPLVAGPPLVRPLFQDPCAAGFPSPASDYVERALDLNELVIRDEAATYYVRAEGRSAMRAGVWSGDLLVVNAALAPEPGDLVVAFVDGEHTVKRFCRDAAGAYLAPDPLPEESHRYHEIRFGDGQELLVCGVVTHVVRSLRGKP
ncbi:translesion error-prone DNA polymerase V autoproteolytic subunit [Rubrivirga sp. IMCC43871]|uniref:translesion error-prone DNA polymerase V autoproteolytic subunit n=1 Tax=Rubrivirga sp. IMCC43871 TaxID=3391575 RepID=UPI0039901583